MSNVNKYSTASIDFDAIRDDLKKFLQFQEEFSDYDFEGSGLSVLLNLLAYNTHYNTVYDNFAINEAFLDTAFKRSSVISHASLLNYIPRSYVSAMAKINVIVTDNSTDAKDILEGKDCYCGWQNNYSRRTHLCRFDLSVFRREKDGKYRREDETQLERCYSEKELRKALSDCGFVHIEFFGDLSHGAPTPECERWFVCARCKK